MRKWWMPKPAATPEEAFWSKVDAGGACWEWTGRRDGRGYGRFGHTGAHRRAWEYLVGPIPDGLELDHLCRNHACVSPDHLEPVTHEVNMARGLNARKTHCKSGHPFAGDNLYVYSKPDGRKQRMCRSCMAARDSARRTR